VSEEEKLFYTIGEAAQVVDVKPYVLRYWESEFKKLNPQKSETGQRTYRKKDLQVALTIKRLLYDEKYTIAGALQKLEELEKAGLDQMDMFGIKTPGLPKPEPPAAEPAEISGDETGRIEPVKIAPQPPAPRPSISREKVRELKNLIAETHSILKKYNLA